jgi:sugar phosphate permease
MSGHPVAKRRKRMQETHVSKQTSRRSGRLSYKWVVLIVAVIGTFMSALDQTIVNIAIPQIQNAFGADIHLVQWVFTGYILAQGVGTPTTAFFADTLGLKRFYIACIALFTISSTLCALAWDLPILIVLRIIQGLSEAGLVPMSLALIFREFPRNQRGLASGHLRGNRAACPGYRANAGRLYRERSWLAFHFLHQRASGYSRRTARLLHPARGTP